MLRPRLPHTVGQRLMPDAGSMSLHLSDMRQRCRHRSPFVWGPWSPGDLTSCQKSSFCTSRPLLIFLHESVYYFMGNLMKLTRHFLKQRKSKIYGSSFCHPGHLGVDRVKPWSSVRINLSWWSGGLQDYSVSPSPSPVPWSWTCIVIAGLKCKESLLEKLCNFFLLIIVLFHCTIHLHYTGSDVVSQSRCSVWSIIL